MDFITIKMQCEIIIEQGKQEKDYKRTLET